LVHQQRVKRELPVLNLTPGDIPETAGGGVRNFTTANFAEALRLQYEGCGNCVKIASGHIEKNQK
jgi:hypothetical protein